MAYKVDLVPPGICAMARVYGSGTTAELKEAIVYELREADLRSWPLPDWGMGGTWDGHGESRSLTETIMEVCRDYEYSEGKRRSREERLARTDLKRSV